MAIDQVNTVDAIGIDKVTSDLVLTITDHLEWTDFEKDHLFLLQEKLNKYLSFVESGEILDAYPDAKGKNIVIEIVCKHQPNSVAKNFFLKASTIIEGAGMRLRFRHVTL